MQCYTLGYSNTGLRCAIIVLVTVTGRGEGSTRVVILIAGLFRACTSQKKPKKLKSDKTNKVGLISDKSIYFTNKMITPIKMADNSILLNIYIYNL